MSPDPVLAAIDDVIADHETLSMQRNAARFDPFPGVWMPGTTMTESSARCAPLETATGPGWVSPPVRYVHGYGYGHVTRADMNGIDITSWVPDDGVPLPDPFGGPVPCPCPPGAAPDRYQDAPVPSRVAAGIDVATHRAVSPLRVWWAALAGRVRR